MRSWSGRPRGRHHDTDEIRRILGAQLLHDISAMVFNGARADSERAPGFLVGGARCKLLEHFAFAPGQWLTSLEMQRSDLGSGAFRLAARKCADRLIQPSDDLAAPERFFDKVERAILDGADSHRDIALPRDHEDGCGVILSTQLLENIQTGLSRNMNVEQDAGRGSAACHGQQCGPVGKADHLIPAGRQDDGKSFADRGIIINYKNFTAGCRFFSHMPSPVETLKQSVIPLMLPRLAM